MQIILKKHSSEKEIKRSSNKDEKMLNVTTCLRHENESKIPIRLTVGEIAVISTHM